MKACAAQITPKLQPVETGLEFLQLEDEFRLTKTLRCVLAVA